MISSTFVDISLIIVVALISFLPGTLRAAVPDAAVQWKLPEYLADAEHKPAQLLAAAELLFSKQSISEARTNPAHANAWQDRLAMLSALSQLHDPAQAQQSKAYLERAAKFIESAMLTDPSLLVRDAAVESMRRINRMRPGYIARWKSALESAFLSTKNQSNGEGYFIRETILSAMREASLKPTQSVMNAARGDTNARVRSRLDDWNTSAF